MKIGNGEFWLGDCLDLMAQIPDASVDMVFTDPPYRVISGGTKSELAAGWNSSVLSKNDGKIFSENNIGFSDYIPQLYRVLRDEAHCYIMTNNVNLSSLLNIAEAVGFSFHNLLVWRKNTCTANRWYMKEMEIVCFFYKKPAKPINDMSSKQIFEFNNPKNKRHPTEKPVELPLHYIMNSSRPGEVVFDPFAGSGSTAIAAQRAGRKWLTCELDPSYYYPAVGRVWSEILAGRK